MKKIASLTNEVYDNGETIVVKKNNDHDLNHKINYKILSEFDFVPKLIKEDREEIIWKKINGEPLESFTNDDLIEIAQKLREVHKSIDLEFPRFNLRKRVMKYIAIINDKRLKITEINDHYRSMTRLLSKMNHINPCHGDLWSQNILKDKDNKIWFIDWEYASMGDKHFDLAYFILSSKLTPEEEAVFLNTYNNVDENYEAYSTELMPSYKRFVLWLILLWAYAQDEIPFDLTDVKKLINEC